MGQMTAGGVTMQNLQQEGLHGGDRREHAIAPAVYPISRHTARMASGGSSRAHSSVKRCRIVVMFGTI
jgi:hypothetical protein